MTFQKMRKDSPQTRRCIMWKHSSKWLQTHPKHDASNNGKAESTLSTTKPGGGRTPTVIGCVVNLPRVHHLIFLQLEDFCLTCLLFFDLLALALTSHEKDGSVVDDTGVAQILTPALGQTCHLPPPEVQNIVVKIYTNQISFSNHKTHSEFMKTTFFFQNPREVYPCPDSTGILRARARRTIISHKQLKLLTLFTTSWSLFFYLCMAAWNLLYSIFLVWNDFNKYNVVVLFLGERKSSRHWILSGVSFCYFTQLFCNHPEYKTPKKE